MNSLSTVFIALALLLTGCSIDKGELKVQGIENNTSSSKISTVAEVNVSTDKKEYKQGDIINVTLKNNLDESIFSHIGSCSTFAIVNVERKTSYLFWEKLFANAQYPYVIYDIGPPAEIKPGKSETMSWEPLLYINGTTKYIQAGPGTYRLNMYYQLRKGNSSTDWKWLTVYSNEFIIK